MSAIINSIIDAKLKLGALLLDKNKIFISNNYLRELFFEIDRCEKREHILNYYFKALNIFPENFYKHKEKRILKKIIIHPGANIEKKRWGIENYFKLIKMLNEEYSPQFIITGGKNEINENKNLTKMLESLSINYTDLTGKVNIKSLVEIIEDSDLLISSDTFIQHLSTLTSIDSITIFLGGAYHYHTFPYQLNRKVIFPDIDCYPCKYSDLCKNNYKCRDLIKPEDILALINGDKVKNSLFTRLGDNNLLELK